MPLLNSVVFFHTNLIAAEKKNPDNIPLFDVTTTDQDSPILLLQLGGCFSALLKPAKFHYVRVSEYLTNLSLSLSCV